MSSSDGVRKRDLVVIPPKTCTEWQRTVSSTGAVNYVESPKAIQLTGHEMTTSRDNWEFAHVRKRKRQAASGGRPLTADEKRVYASTDLGGPFENVQRTVWASPREVHPRRTGTLGTGTIDAGYDGPWFAVSANVGPSSSLYPAVPGDLTDRMIGLGTTAIARVIPTNPLAGAAQFIGELRNQVPSIPGASLLRRPDPRGVADEYLNYEFGIRPIINDLKKFRQAAQDASKHLAQLERDSGRIVRRRYSFPETRTVQTFPEVTGTGAPTFNSGAAGLYLNSSGKLTRTRVTTERFWFSGAFTYHYPGGNTFAGRMARREADLNRLFGLRITPETLWELTPWSWLIDWKVNAGDLVHNISAFSRDGLVMRWGYMMANIRIVDTYRLDGLVLRDGSSGPLVQQFTTEVKKRIKATPYGFGLDPGAFTTRQWAILGALGISRVPGKL